jgi:hypothetical protein
VPTTFGVIVLGLLVIGGVAGLVLWARGIQRRSSESKRHVGSEAPFDAEAAAARQARNLGNSGPL